MFPSDAPLMFAYIFSIYRHPFEEITKATEENGVGNNDTDDLTVKVSIFNPIHLFRDLMSNGESVQHDS